MMEPTDTSTCTGCGAPLAAPQLPCPYCGQRPISAPLSAATPTEAAPVFPGAAPWGQAPYLAGGPGPQFPVQGAGQPWPPSQGAGPIWASPLLPPVPVVRRRLRLGCWIGALVVLLMIAIPVVIAVMALQVGSSRANVQGFALTPGDPVQVAAAHLDQLRAYMQAGLANNPDSAYALYVHDAARLPPSRADIAQEFQAHPEHYQGFAGLVPVDWRWINSKGIPSYWRVRAQATYAGGATRAVQADLVQKTNTWQLIAVTFP